MEEVWNIPRPIVSILCRSAWILNLAKFRAISINWSRQKLGSDRVYLFHLDLLQKLALLVDSAKVEPRIDPIFSTECGRKRPRLPRKGFQW